MDPVYTIKYKDYTIEIHQDDPNENPNELFNDVFLVGFHRNFHVEYNGVNIELARIMHGKTTCKIGENTYWIFGLEAYIHSGVVLALSNEGNFPDRQWDVSQLGLVFVSKDCYKSKKTAKKFAEEFIKQWNMYLSGEVYGYKILETDDSCWGYYGMEAVKKAAMCEIDTVLTSSPSHSE